jgi:protein-S-isoprenylcysteine O-methyltransferase Ste14
MEILRISVGSLLVISFGFLIFRIVVRWDYRRNNRLTWYITLLQAVVYFLHGSLAYLYLPVKYLTIPPLSGNHILNIFGLVFIGLALILLLTTMGMLGYAKTMGVELKELKETGFYRFSRNPQLIFYNFFLIGIALLWPSWYAIPWIMVYYILAHMMVTTEEENLRSKFGNSYLDYCSRVPRYLAFHSLK